MRDAATVFRRHPARDTIVEPRQELQERKQKTTTRMLCDVELSVLIGACRRLTRRSHRQNHARLVRQVRQRAVTRLARLSASAHRVRRLETQLFEVFQEALVAVGRDVIDLV